MSGDTPTGDRRLLDLLARVHGDGGHHTGAVGLEQSALDAHRVVARLRAEVQRLTQVDEEQERDHSKAIHIASARVAEAVDLRAEVKRLDMQLRVEGAVRARSASDGRVVAKMGIRNRELMAEVEAAIERAETAEHAPARLRERVRRSESPERARAIIAAWVRTGEPGNDITEPGGVCIEFDLAAIHSGTTDEPGGDQ